MAKINVQKIDVTIFKINEDEYISLTDIARYRDAERSDYNLQNWMRNRSTIEFIGLWEMFNNPGFNSIEFDGIKNLSGSNSFALTPFINENMPQPERLMKRNQIARHQMKVLLEVENRKLLKENNNE